MKTSPYELLLSSPEVRGDERHLLLMRAANLLKACSVFLASVACSPSRIAISDAELATLRSQKSIFVVIHAPESLSFVRAGDNFRTGLAAAAAGALTGGIGGVLVGMQAESRAREQGQELARANALDDPALKVRDGFVSALVTQFNMTNLFLLDEQVTTDDPKAMGAKLGTEPVLDFKTSVWRLEPAGSDSQYRVIYHVRARFLSIVEEKVLWQGYCRYDGGGTSVMVPEQNPQSSGWLQAKMDEVAEACATTLFVEFVAQR